MKSTIMFNMGTLYVVATPIGNLEDITLRAIKILLTTEVIACEDTRHTGQLLKIFQNKYGANFLETVTHKFISVRDWNEKESIDRILNELKDHDVALVSDAGTPLISDPGFKIVRAARNAGFKVSPIPGPSALAAALSASGVPTDKFVFRGFLPKKWDLDTSMTNVIYESPKRVKKTVDEIKLKYPESKIVIAHEMTKIHEKFWDLGFDAWDLQIPQKGEFVILVSFDR